MVKAVRGAVQVREDSREAIWDGAFRLVTGMLSENRLAEADIVSLVFSVTRDLRAANPAAGLRQHGFALTPLFCVQEADVDGGMPRVIRALLTYNAKGRRQPIAVYLDGARALRPDLRAAEKTPRMSRVASVWHVAREYAGIGRGGRRQGCRDRPCARTRSLGGEGHRGRPPVRRTSAGVRAAGDDGLVHGPGACPRRALDSDRGAGGAARLHPGWGSDHARGLSAILREARRVHVHRSRRKGEPAQEAGDRALGFQPDERDPCPRCPGGGAPAGRVPVDHALSRRACGAPACDDPGDSPLRGAVLADGRGGDDPQCGGRLPPGDLGPAFRRPSDRA